jgi:hypothetical protein
VRQCDTGYILNRRKPQYDCGHAESVPQIMSATESPQKICRSSVEFFISATAQRINGHFKAIKYDCLRRYKKSG